MLRSETVSPKYRIFRLLKNEIFRQKDIWNWKSVKIFLLFTPQIKFVVYHHHSDDGLNTSISKVRFSNCSGVQFGMTCMPSVKSHLDKVIKLYRQKWALHSVIAIHTMDKHENSSTKHPHVYWESVRQCLDRCNFEQLDWISLHGFSCTHCWKNKGYKRPWVIPTCDNWPMHTHRRHSLDLIIN